VLGQRWSTPRRQPLLGLSTFRPWPALSTGHADCRPPAVSASHSSRKTQSGRDFGRLFDSPQWPCARGLSDRCAEKPSPLLTQPPYCRAQRITRRLRRRLYSLRQADLVPPGIAGHTELRAPAGPVVCERRAYQRTARETRQPHINRLAVLSKTCGVAGRGRAASPTRGGLLNACATRIFNDRRLSPGLHTRCRPVCRIKAYRTCSIFHIVTCSIPLKTCRRGDAFRVHPDMSQDSFCDMETQECQGPVPLLALFLK
jgi:hypothetical protein